MVNPLKSGMAKLIVDYREKKIIGDLSQIFNEIEVTVLPIGDIVIVKRTNPFWSRFHELDIEYTAIVIERKSMTDFIGSIRSGRIWDQMKRICNLDIIKGRRIQYRILAVHGTFNDYFAQIPSFQIDDKINGDGFWRFVTNTMTDIIFKYGIPIIMLNNKKQFIEFVRYLSHLNLNYINADIKRRGFYNKKRVGSTGQDIQVDILSSIPLISSKLADRLLEEFQNIFSICEASQKDLRKVKGIGKKKAEIIYGVLHDEYKNIDNYK